MDSTIQGFLNNINDLPIITVYMFFFISAVLQMVFPPYPGDTVFIFGGYLASRGIAGGPLHIFIPYFLGTVLSSIFLYELGAWKGESILNSRMITRFFSPAKQTNAKSWVIKYGVAIIFVCKFIPGINSLLILFCGILRYKRVWAFLALTFAVLTHNITFFLIGGAIGENWDNIIKFLSLYNKIVLGTVALGAIVYIAVRLFSMCKARKIPKGDKS